MTGQQVRRDVVTSGAEALEPAMRRLPISTAPVGCTSAATAPVLAAAGVVQQIHRWVARKG